MCLMSEPADSKAHNLKSNAQIKNKKYGQGQFEFPVILDQHMKNVFLNELLI